MVLLSVLTFYLLLPRYFRCQVARDFSRDWTNVLLDLKNLDQRDIEDIIQGLYNDRISVDIAKSITQVEWEKLLDKSTLAIGYKSLLRHILGTVRTSPSFDRQPNSSQQQEAEGVLKWLCLFPFRVLFFFFSFLRGIFDSICYSICFLFVLNIFGFVELFTILKRLCDQIENFVTVGPLLLLVCFLFPPLALLIFVLPFYIILLTSLPALISLMILSIVAAIVTNGTYIIWMVRFAVFGLFILVFVRVLKLRSM